MLLVGALRGLSVSHAVSVAWRVVDDERRVAGAPAQGLHTDRHTGIVSVACRGGITDTLDTHRPYIPCISVLQKSQKFVKLLSALISCNVSCVSLCAHEQRS